jgi:apolipoprotein N-acyltransferase
MMIVTTAHGGALPDSPINRPITPVLRMLLVCWMAALLAGLYAAFLLRRVPRLRRYTVMVPLTLLLVSGLVLAGCATGTSGTPAGTSQLTITATSGTLSQTTSAALTVQ